MLRLRVDCSLSYIAPLVSVISLNILQKCKKYKAKYTRACEGFNRQKMSNANGYKKLKMLKIGIIDVSEREGGRRAFIDNFYKALKKEGYAVDFVDLKKASVDVLNSFNILHFSSHFWGKQLWKLLLATRPKKILTIHGWVMKERLHDLRHMGLGFRASCREFIYSLLSLVFLRIAPLLFDAITCPSKRTAEENRLKTAAIISNALFPEYFRNIDEINVRRKQNDVLFVTYVSIGGLKNVAVARTLKVVRRLNEVLKRRKVTLLVFGKDYPSRDESPYVHFMGFSDKFLRVLRSSDLFITGKTFSEIGYAEMEAGILGIPVAKFTTDSATEEIIDGQTGILAKTEDEMVRKLLDYVSDLENAKQTLGNNFRKYIENEKSWSKVIGRWNELFMHVCQRTEKESGSIKTRN